MDSPCFCLPGSQALTRPPCVWLVDGGVGCEAVFLMSWFLPAGTMTAVKTQHSLAGQVYAVPLIQPDLRREEAIQQVADALQYLQNISGDIFSRWDPVQEHPFSEGHSPQPCVPSANKLFSDPTSSQGYKCLRAHHLLTVV